MARISVEELYRSEIMGAVTKEILTRGVPEAYDEQTWIEMLIVKHTLTIAEQMKNEGDFVSGMTDAEPPSCYAEVQNENT